MFARVIGIFCAMALAVVLSGCGGGGGGDDSDPPASNNPAPPAPGIGAAGGTVTGPSGAKVVIPAGALSANADIQVAQSSAGAPALPAGATTFGQMFAFTPHGTTFTSPVTITVPFDPAQVPAGTTPVMFKTTAGQTDWSQVAGVTISGNTMSAAVSSFSFVVAGSPPPPPLEKGTPKRSRFVAEIDHRRFAKQPLRDNGNLPAGEAVDTLYDFGPMNMQDPGVPLDILPREFRATGHLFSSAGGGSYGVSTEAPIAHSETDVAGNFVDFTQKQSYAKRDANARLTLRITQARLEAFDDGTPDPGPCSNPSIDCADQKYAQVVYNVTAYSKPSTAHPKVRKLFRGQGYMDLEGWRGHWKPTPALPDEVPVTKIWTADDVLADVDVGAQDGRQAHVGLKKAISLPIDISSIDVDEEFTLSIAVDAYVFDGRPAAEFNYLGAFFRDPTLVDGNPQVILEGLDPTDSPTDEPVDDPDLAEECHALPAAGRLQFASAAYNVPEGAAASGISLLVLRTGGSAGEVSATVKTSDGTATAPLDYQSVSTTVTFPDGDLTPRFINVPLVYSTADEDDKTFTVTLSEPSDCTGLGVATSEVTIIDDTRPVPPEQIFTLSGNVSGLVGSGLMLRTNLFDQVQVAADGTFEFPVPLADATAYTVTVATQPSNPLQICTITNGSGTIANANVTNIQVTCVLPPPVSGLDASFGSQGKLFDPTANATALALQADGKLLTLGGLKLSRYNTDGSVDTTFGSNGKVTIVALGNGLDAMTALAVQPDGKIVVVGFTSLPTAFNDDFIVLRFNANGSADSTFGTGGKTLTDFVGFNDQAKSVLLQADGKIVVAGQAQLGTQLSVNQDYAVVRYLSDGSLDPSFGTGGKTTLDFGGRSDFVNAAALQADGKIVVVGRVFTDGGSGNSDMGIARFLSNGGVDTGFGFQNQGFERIDFKTASIASAAFDGGDWDEAKDLVILSDGKILVAGYRIDAGVFKAAIARLLSNGSFATGFGEGALLTSTAIDEADGIALQADGKIVITGPSAADFGVARFSSTGVLDGTFATNGALKVDFFGAFDKPADVVIQPDGRIIAAGSAKNGSSPGLGAIRVLP